MSSPYTDVSSPNTNVFATHIMVLFLMIFGRIELILSVSKAKFDEEADFEVRLSLNPQKPSEKHKTTFFQSVNPPRPLASGRVER